MSTKLNGNFKHGMTGTPEHNAYRSAKYRCTNPNDQAFAHYGGRGIEFRFTSFEQFITHIGLRPPKHTLDRIDNEGHYEAGNVRWLLPSPSNVNRRKQKNNTSGYRGVSFEIRASRWRAQIRLNLKRYHLGYFDSPVAAAHAYDTAAKQIHGEHARLNFPD